MSWSEPCGHTRSRSGASEDSVMADNSTSLDTESIPDTPEEISTSVPQAELDANTKEMTCGPKLEEIFWPIRHQIRYGKLRNTTGALIVHARKESQPMMLSKLADESTLDTAEISSNLTSFLHESSTRYGRLRQMASEMGVLDLKRFKEAVWEDRLTIILVFYEVLTSKRDLEEILKLRGTQAQFMLDLMQDAIRIHADFVHCPEEFLNGLKELGLLRNVDRASAHLDARRLIVQLSEAADLLPSSLTIHGIENTKETALGGNFGDIFTASHRGQAVAVKRLRFFQADGDEVRKKFCREALIWKNLEHDNILPFLGVDSETFPGFLCMVSLWMDRGSLASKSGAPSEGAIPTLIYEIAVGIQYLHSQNIVHGDIRGTNILVDEQGHARLADFGLAVFADTWRFFRGLLPVISILLAANLRSLISLRKGQFYSRLSGAIDRNCPRLCRHGAPK
ncbi:kinase-like domain-containing protein [Mycena metata]|uniref:Kinase-like domain-containing protein n=1 Tax=Mycena metata TaxID=1033252 RepID=A0AAD7H6Q8_9AGAR|nr:kinase-like domain-containing protein [Mycena metata]